MSKAAVKWVAQLKATREFRGAAKSVLRELAYMADEKQHSCYPGQDLLAERTCTSVRTVRRAIEVLERNGLVLVERRFNKRGHRTSDLYWLQLDVTEIPDREAAAVEPAGGSDEMSAEPVENSPTGHSGLRSICPSLPANVSIPTGQVGRLHTDESPGESLVEGGASAPAPSPTCGRHPNGTTQPCRACGDARRLWDARLQQPAEPFATKRAPRYDFDVYCEHLQLRTSDCEACAEDARSALRNAGFFAAAGAA